MARCLDRHLRYGIIPFRLIDENAPVLLIPVMVEGQVRVTCLKEIEDLARMTEQHRRALEFLWVKLEDLGAAIQASRNAKTRRWATSRAIGLSDGIPK